MKLSKTLDLVKPSPTLEISALAEQMRAQGRDVISLSSGEPDFDTPEHIKQAAIDAINKGITKYTSVDGVKPLKEAIQSKFITDNGLHYDLNQICVNVGAKQGCYNLCQAILNAGDEVIIPTPYWVSYPDIVLLAGATPIIVECPIESEFKLTAELLKSSITDRTRLIFLNSPSNPSGALYSKEELKSLAEVLLDHPNVLIISDDIYEKIIFNNLEFANILNVEPALKDRTIVVNGVSKTYAMTGWRIGYMAGDSRIIKAVKTIQGQSTSNPTSIAQYAALEAIKGSQENVAQMLEQFSIRHKYVYERLSSIDKINVLPSAGSFYTFPEISAVMLKKGYKSDVAFTADLLEKHGVAAVPGSGFGSQGHLRMSFATSMEKLEKALDKFEVFCKS